MWVIWRVLQQQPFGAALWKGLAAAAYLAALVEAARAVHDDALRAASAALLLGLGAGLLALLGASAVLGQLGISVAAGAGEVLLLQMFGPPVQIGWTLVWPAVVVTGLIGVLAVFTGELRWYSLPALLAVPWATRWGVVAGRPPWLTAILSCLAALVPVVLAVTLAWVGASGPGA